MKGLPLTDVMLKQGLSWGGFAVRRLPPSDVAPNMMNSVIPELEKLPSKCRNITMMVQAKLDLVSELRWCMVNGELRGREWKSLNMPKVGQLAESAGYQEADQARSLVEKFCAKLGKYTIEELEVRMGEMCKKVYAEAVADAWGESPLYMRVDLLLDRQGRIWLGERESWGADINGNDTKELMDPTYKELANKMITNTKKYLSGAMKSQKRKVCTSSSTKVAAKRMRSVA